MKFNLDTLREQAEFLDAHTRRFLRSAGLRPGMSVLDVGSGTGAVSAIAAALVGPHGRVTGIDPDPAMVRAAVARPARPRSAPMRFLAEPLERHTAEVPYDAVVGRLVLTHVPNLAGATARIAELVRPGGVVAFQEAVILPAPPLGGARGRDPEVARAAEQLAGLMVTLAARGRGYRGMDLLDQLAGCGFDVSADVDLAPLRPVVRGRGAAHADLADDNVRSTVSLGRQAGLVTEAEARFLLDTLTGAEERFAALWALLAGMTGRRTGGATAAA